MNLDRMMKLRFTSGFTIRSTYRWRYRSSRSCRPWNFSGRGSSALLKRMMFLARTLISPRWVRNTSPSTPTMSPMSNFLNFL